MTTKIRTLTDAPGNLVDFRLLPGQAHDLRAVPELISGLSADQLLADRAFDADWLRADLRERKIVPVIPPKATLRFPAAFDKDTYKWRRATCATETPGPVVCTQIDRLSSSVQNRFVRRAITHPQCALPNGGHYT